MAIVLISSTFLTLAQEARSQTKIGYIVFQELLDTMPGYKKAEVSLKEYRDALTHQYFDLIEDYKRSRNPDTIPFPEFRTPEMRVDVVRSLERRIRDWPQESERLYMAKREELLNPIRDKAKRTIATVAKENGIAYVFYKETFLFVADGENLLPLVKKKLKIE